MRGCGSAILSAVVGAVLGAIIVTIVGWQYMSARYPGFSTDGQSAMIVFATVPIGGVLGAVMGFGYGLWRGSRGG